MTSSALIVGLVPLFLQPSQIQAGPSRQPLPRVRFVRESVLEGNWRLPLHAGWSPTRAQLLVIGDGGLHLLDCASPSHPRLLVKGIALHAVWSPDGNNVACVLWNAPGDRTLVVVSSRGGTPRTLASGNEVGHPLLWGRDGVLRMWGHGKPGERRDFALTESLRPRTESVPGPVLVQTMAHGELELMRFDPSGKMADVLLNAGDLSEYSHVTLQGSFPDGEHYLVTAQGSRGTETLVITLSGSVTQHLGLECGPIGEESVGLPNFSGSSVSADGRYVAGHTEVDNEYDIESATLKLARVDGAWVVPVSDAPPGIAPQMSRQGMRIAFRDPIGGSFYVGTLRVTER